MDEKPTILPLASRQGRDSRKLIPVKLTKLQREAMIAATRLRRGIKNKIGEVAEGTQILRFTRKEIDKTAGEVNTAIDFAPNPYKKRLVAVEEQDRGRLDGLDDVNELPPPNIRQGVGLKTPNRSHVSRSRSRTSSPRSGGGSRCPTALVGDLQRCDRDRHGLAEGPPSDLHQFHRQRRVMHWATRSRRPRLRDGHGIGDEEGIHLSRIVFGKMKARFVYEYDFGDGWRHEVVFEKTVEGRARGQVPPVRRGEAGLPARGLRRATGVTPTSSQRSATRKGPAHYWDMKEWVGGRRSSAEAVNQRLKGRLR